ncbi:MAG TPA: XdhC family protein [Actinomycetota bacterium]|nr:XdhC family protein [Actinomycetota bacterium]
MAKDLLELAHEFHHGGEAFALATVVWRRAPSSGKVGYKALVTANGDVSGWVAGACTEPLVVRQSLKAMADGEPRLMLIGAPEDLETRARDGLLAFPTTCASEGALEIYIEPHLPTPQLVIVGRSPVVDTMATLANGLGWRTVIVDDEGGSLSDHSVADQVWNSLDLKGNGVNAGSYVVVATLGHYDEDALEAALATDAAYIGLVASKKRAGTVMDYLRENGVPEEQLARIKAPAGLDLGRIKHEEMAVAVIAEIVQLKAAAGNNRAGSTGAMHGGAEKAAARQAQEAPMAHPGHDGHSHADGHRHHAGHDHATQEPESASQTDSKGSSGTSPSDGSAYSSALEEAVDPVCNMTVTVKGARYTADHEGQTYYFCCPACRKLFQNNPQEYLKVKQEA